MDKVKWSDQLSTGFDAVDNQHRRLLEVLNQLIALAEPTHEPERAEVEAAVRELGRYARQHFDDEMRLMQETSVDLRHVMMHAREHEHFVRHVSMFEESMGDPGATNAAKAAELGGFLAKWLWRHILVIDHVMAGQVRRIQAGEDAAAAYEAELTASPDSRAPNESYA